MGVYAPFRIECMQPDSVSRETLHPERYRAFDGTRRTVRVDPLSLALYDLLQLRIAGLARQMARVHGRRG